MESINRVLRGMKTYQKQSGCDLNITYNKELNRKRVYFYDWGLSLELHIDTEQSKVLIVEFSEDESLNGTTMSEEEFAKWQIAFIPSENPQPQNFMTSPESQQTEEEQK